MSASIARLRNLGRLGFLTAATGLAWVAAATAAKADENGIPFWLSGQFASFAATPASPGWTATLIPYIYGGSASGNTSFPRGGRVTASPDAQSLLMVTQISYAPDTKILNGQLSLGLAVLPGVSSRKVGATAAFGSLAAEGRRSQTVAGFGDLYPVASLAWNQGVNNYMAYVTGDIPVGLYGPSNFSNLGIGHGAIDGGGGYTYLDPTSGREISTVVGATFNFINPSTDYTNGVDLHLDWAASQFLSEQWQVGVVGVMSTTR